MVTFANTRVSPRVVLAQLTLCRCCHRSFLHPSSKCLFLFAHLHSHRLFVQSLAPASSSLLLCSFQHPHICTATCKPLTCDAWHFALPPTTCTVNVSAGPSAWLVVHVALKRGSPKIRVYTLVAVLLKKNVIIFYLISVSTNKRNQNQQSNSILSAFPTIKPQQVHVFLLKTYLEINPEALFNFKKKGSIISLNRWAL